MPHLPRHTHRQETPDWLRAVNPFGWVTRTMNWFSPDGMPPLTRPNYAKELAAAFFLPWIMAVVEGGVIGVIVKKFFHGVADEAILNYAVATLTSAPAFANITSFVWVRLTHGRHKVRSITALQVAVIMLVGLIAATPHSAFGLWMTVACAVGARVCISGVATLRATVWRLNYPRQVRAALTGRIVTVLMLVLAVVGTLVGAAMEYNPSSFRVFIPAAAAVALIGVKIWSGVRVRGHRALLTAERTREQRPSFNPLRMIRLLIDDKRYGAFMLCQFTLGAGNLMLLAPLVLIVTDHFHLGYFSGILATHAIPIITMPFFVNIWAKRLDAWHITTYRAVHSWVFVVMAGLIFAAAQLNLVWLLYLGVVARGIAFAGGALAWNLGHNDFARDDNAAQYMAVHVTLTGLRGLIMPFVGVSLYEWFERVEPGGGSWVFVVGGAIVVVGALGFYAMHRRFGRGPANHAEA